MTRKYNIRIFAFILVLMTAVLGLMPSAVLAQYSEIITKYVDAMDKNDALGMEDVVAKNKGAMPAELKALIDKAKAPDTAPELRDEYLYVAESIGRVYMEQTGDKEYLISAKRAIFESKLSPQVHSTAKDGFHIVEMPASTDHTKNYFRPDNIIIKKGESVKWINNDTVDHVFASMPVIGLQGIKTSSIPPGGSYTFKFDNTGVYYYICYIHHAMLGKITVEGDEALPEVKEEPKKLAPIEEPSKIKNENNKNDKEPVAQEKAKEEKAVEKMAGDAKDGADKGGNSKASTDKSPAIETGAAGQDKGKESNGVIEGKAKSGTDAGAVKSDSGPDTDVKKSDKAKKALDPADRESAKKPKKKSKNKNKKKSGVSSEGSVKKESKTN